MNWLLVVVLVILVVNALIGRKVGLIKTIFSLCSMIVALILTVWISPTVNDLMSGNEKFNGYISEKVETMVPFEEKLDEDDSTIEKLPLPQSIKDVLIENRALSTENIKVYITSYLTGIVIKALAFMLTFFIIIVMLWVISFTLNLISKLPILNQINKTAGLIAGLVHGLIIVWLFFILLTVFGGSGFGQDALKLIGESKLLSFLYNNNFLLGFVTNATKILF